jgi:hypothetical protein
LVHRNSDRLITDSSVNEDGDDSLQGALFHKQETDSDLLKTQYHKQTTFAFPFQDPEISNFEVGVF